MYKIYAVNSRTYYAGTSFVAADSAEEANSFVEAFKKRDKGNLCDSWGYMLVDESDLFEGLYAEEKGIVYHGIHYCG